MKKKKVGRRKIKSQPHKLQVAFHPMALRQLQRLTSERGAPSYAEIVTDATHVLRIIQKLKRLGYLQIVAERGDSKNVMNLPQFPDELPLSQNASEEHIRAIQELIAASLKKS